MRHNNVLQIVVVAIMLLMRLRIFLRLKVKDKHNPLAVRHFLILENYPSTISDFALQLETSSKRLFFLYKNLAEFYKDVAGKDGEEAHIPQSQHVIGNLKRGLKIMI